MVKVSVIIPVYNTEKYLRECLDSIINQSLKDIEIICINDGSTDNSLNILEEYAKKDSRLTIISQENKGQGAGRNKGLSIAKGEYIYFMDSDDILKLNTLEDNYEICHDKSLDFSMFQLINYNDYSDEYYCDDDYDMPKVVELIDNKVFSYKDLGEIIFKVAVSPVNKLYNRNFLVDLDVKFPEDVIFEDNIFFWNVFFNAKRLFFIKKHYYIRRRHLSSTTGYANENFIDTLKIHNNIIDIFKKYDLFDDFKKNLFNKKINLAYVRFNQVKNEIKPLFYDAMKNDFENMVDEYNFEEILLCLSKNNKIIFNNVFNSRGYEELILLVENDKLKIKNKKLKKKNNKLIKEIGSTNDENNLILSSTRWKITKPLRFIKKIFKQ